MNSCRFPVVVVLLLAACGGGTTEPKPESVQVASVSISGSGTTLSIGGTLQLAATAKDASGKAIAGREIVWTSMQPAIASVSATGLVTGLAPGSASITASTAGRTGTFQLDVEGLPNVTLSAVWLTQGTQRPDGTVPLVIGGLPALVNIVGTVYPAFGGLQPQVRVRVYEGTVLRFEDTKPMDGRVRLSADPANPLAQVMVPSEWIRPNMRIEVVANPAGAVAEERLDDNVWPLGGGQAAVPVVAVPPLEVHFVPIHLTVGGSTGTVTPASLQEYLYSVRQMFPVAVVTGSIGATFSTDVNFGGGSSTAWTQILPQLDALRVIEGTTRYYVGALRPPPGITSVQNGGWGYIPANPLLSGPGTRTSLVVGVGWFNRQEATQELVAHELGHNHGRRHAPCGNPSGVDASYPYIGGTLGVWAHDIYSVFTGRDASVRALSPDGGYDIMSYCWPAWTSDYTYLGLQAVRTALVASPPPAPVPCDCLIITGTTTDSGVEVGPVFETAAHIALPPEGDHRVEGLDAAGRVLFAVPFAPSIVDHAPGVRQFVLAIPRDRLGGGTLAQVRVVDGSGRSALAPRGDVVSPSVTGRRIGLDAMELSWDAGRTPGVLVRDPASGRVVGIGRSGRLMVHTTAPEVDVVVAGAMGSHRRRVRVQ